MRLLTQEKIFLGNTMLSTELLENGICVRLEPLLRRIKLVKVSISGRFDAKTGCFVSVTKWVRISTTDILPTGE